MGCCCCRRRGCPGVDPGAVVIGLPPRGLGLAVLARLDLVREKEKEKERGRRRQITKKRSRLSGEKRKEMDGAPRCSHPKENRFPVFLARTSRFPVPVASREPS